MSIDLYKYIFLENNKLIVMFYYGLLGVGKIELVKEIVKKYKGNIIRI